MQQVLGARPPKAAKGDYARFRELVRAALGGDTPSEELEAATRAAWVAISRVPKADTSARLSAATLLRPFRQVLSVLRSHDSSFRFSFERQSVQKQLHWHRAPLQRPPPPPPPHPPPPATTTPKTTACMPSLTPDQYWQ